MPLDAAPLVRHFSLAPATTLEHPVPSIRCLESPATHGFP